MHTPKKKKFDDGFYPRSQYEDALDSQFDSVGYNCLTQTNDENDYYNQGDKRILLNNSLINLNVGGIKYTTTLSTLEKDTNSFLFKFVYHTLNGLDLPNDTNNYRGFFNFTDSNSGGIMEIFIDRDGKNFQYILNYLRDGTLICPEDVFTYRLILSDAKFYGLNGLVKILNSKIDPDTEMCVTPVRVIKEPEPPVLQSQNTQIEQSDTIQFTNASSSEPVMPQYNIFLRMDETDNIEESMSFVQTTPIRSLGEEKFSTTVDF